MLIGYQYDFSILIVAYNHEHFIAEAIESVLKQQFKGSMEIIISIDKSKDDTLTVGKQYKQKFPHLIKLVEQQQHVGMYHNFKSAFATCTGKYIALLEGDDYWTDPEKLQLQYDFFEENEHCVLSAGLSGTIQNGVKQYKKPGLAHFSTGKVFRKSDIVYVNRLVTLTTAFRSSAFNWDEFEKLCNAPHLDWGIYLSLTFSEKSFIYRFNRKFGDYRIHEGGIYSLVGSEKRNTNFLKTIFALSFLQLEDRQKEYLRYLFANFSSIHNINEFLLNEPYKSHFDVGLLIYESKFKLRNDYVRQISSLLFRSMQSETTHKELVRFHFELIRQTKYSKLTYLNLKLIPFLIVALVYKVETYFYNYSLIKKGKNKNIPGHLLRK